MKRLSILVLIMVLAFSNIVYAKPSDSEIASSFKKYVKEEVNRALATYDKSTYTVKRYKKRSFSAAEGVRFTYVWRKEAQELKPEYTIDLRKNDSLISPYIGTVNISKKYYRSNDCTTKEEAEQATCRKGSSEYKFTIAYQDDKWVVIKAHAGFSDIETTSIYDALKYKQ